MAGYSQRKCWGEVGLLLQGLRGQEARARASVSRDQASVSVCEPVPSGPSVGLLQTPSNLLSDPVKISLNSYTMPHAR